MTVCPPNNSVCPGISSGNPFFYNSTLNYLTQIFLKFFLSFFRTIPSSPKAAFSTAYCRICDFLTIYGYTALLYGTASFVSGLCKLCFDKKGYDIDFIVREILCRKFYWSAYARSIPVENTARAPSCAFFASSSPCTMELSAHRPGSLLPRSACFLPRNPSRRSAPAAGRSAYGYILRRRHRPRFSSTGRNRTGLSCSDQAIQHLTAVLPIFLPSEFRSSVMVIA